MIATSPTSVLTERLRERISREGPISFRDWMESALYDPLDGYYRSSHQNKWGREGDYRTSPERSALFAMTFARYFSALYKELGSPRHWTILEAGAGDGQFASGVLQTLQKFFPEVFAATAYVVDEVSEALGTLARERLRPFAARVRFESLKQTRIDRGLVFSNELLDAFPVHRVTMRDGEIQEFFITTDANKNFEWIVDKLSTARLASYVEKFLGSLKEEDVAEVNLEIEDWLTAVADCVCDGYLVTVDYGAETQDLESRSKGEGTLRGFRRHQFVEDLLHHPGEHDLTTTVDWSFVKSVGDQVGLQTVEFDRQDKFLLAAGLLDQLATASELCDSEADRLRLSTTAREMILPDGMASHFQVLVQRKV